MSAIQKVQVSSAPLSVTAVDQEVAFLKAVLKDDHVPTHARALAGNLVVLLYSGSGRTPEAHKNYRRWDGMM